MELERSEEGEGKSAQIPAGGTKNREAKAPWEPRPLESRVSALGKMGNRH